MGIQPSSPPPSSPLFETIPVTIGPALLAFIKSIGDGTPLRVPVRPVAGAEPGMCHKNAARAAAETGGTPVVGQCIWEGALFATSESHVVVRLADGSFVDPTPTKDGEREIVFVVQPEVPPDFDFLQRAQNRRVRLYEGLSEERRASDLIACMTPTQRVTEALKAHDAGVDLTAYVSRRFERDHLETAIEKFLDLSAQAEAMLRPTLHGMWCENIPQWRTLEERRAHAALRLEKTWRARHPGP